MASAGSRRSSRLHSNRERADPVPCHSEDRVGQRRNNRWQRRLTEARGRLLGFHPRNLDLRCRMYPCQLEVVEVALLGDPVNKLDLLTGQRLRQAIDDRSLDLVLRAHGIHNLAANITGHPHLVNGDVAFDHTRLDDFSEVTLMAEIETESLG